MTSAITEAVPSLHGAINSETDSTRKIRLLVFTSLYPNAAQPRHGVFVEERLRHLVGSTQVEATVVAPVPWFPLRHRRFGTYSAFARVPRQEQRYGIQVLHPRYPVIPKLGMAVAPTLMYHAMLPVFRKLQANEADFDLIDAHYFYPDGVTAVRMGRTIGKPVVVTARGSDVTVIPNHPGPRRQIQWAAENAAAVVTVSRALKNKLETLGVRSDYITVLRNGVDLDRFAPGDREAIRTRLSLSGPVWLSVGHLIELKGAHLAIEALARFPDATLLIAGVGPEGARLQQLVDRLGLQTRVRFLGAVPHSELYEYYNAADVLMHCSSREGMPNVVLESLACGTPAIVTPFDGACEVVGSPEAGQVADSRTTDAVCAAWSTLRERAPDRQQTRRYAAMQLGWGPTMEKQLALYKTVLQAWQGGGLHSGLAAPAATMAR